MKRILTICILVTFVIAMAGCEGMLDKKPLGETTDSPNGYWKSEQNIKTFAWGFYTHFFLGYSTGFAGGKFYTYNGYSKITDDYGYASPPQFARHAPQSSGSWSGGYAWIYKANVFIKRIKNSPVDESVKKKWLGVARFFRALEYNRMVRLFGAVPYYGHVVRENNEQELYKERTPRTQVADSMLADFQYAVKNVPISMGKPGLTVNKDVIRAYMSRVFLFQGSWLYYHKTGKKKEAIKFLKAAKSAANKLIESGRYSITSKYRALFSSTDLAGNPGIILYRHYKSGSSSHSMVAYSSYVVETGPTKDVLDAYLMDDGLPISLSSEYQGDKSIKDIFAHRDPRMTTTFYTKSLRLEGAPATQTSNYLYSSTGIRLKKYVNYDMVGTHTGRGPYNTTDAPVMRYGEVLLNYVEATAILAQMGQGTLTQHDLDISINKLRDRPVIKMPHLQIMGNMPAVNGQTYDDPNRDPDVSPIMWEIRRERRIELYAEGFRQYDLKRWAKLDYADFSKNPDINRGAWINFNDWPSDVKDALTLANHGQLKTNKGYIVPDPNQVSWRDVKPRDYLAPLPLDQIQLYKKHGVTLKQNPGW